MTDFYAAAKAKLLAEKKDVRGVAESVMKSAVCDALLHFCRQDAEFAEAVVQGGTFTDCMKAVAQSVGSSISDLEAYRRAVGFYFRGASVRFEMHIQLVPEAEPQPESAKDSIVIDLGDFL